ncbi:MAG: replication-associated recombination protein A [Victivallaceae bacterium]|nr:replication-associated recombination protein A [Victivallaceae bacterium]
MLQTAADQPLAARLRPRSFAEYAGQRHILGEGKLLRRAVEADRFSSIILCGPPGTGKTTLAELIAGVTNCAFIRLSGVTSNVADVRKAVASALALRQTSGRKTILFVDEIHRFNKAQQDSLLPDVENGNVRLIGATTHNVQFYVTGALLSRSLVFQLRSLSEEEIIFLIDRALSDERGFAHLPVRMDQDAKEFLAVASEGDGRCALNALELAVLTTPVNGERVIPITRRSVEESIQKKIAVYGDDGHYDSASAFIKSMRGSDPDAAIYYLAKMLEAGEDPRFIARRLMIFSSEDIGNADPRALPLTTAAMQAVDFVGMPEAQLILAQAVTFCATAPKSNASCIAISSATEDVKNNRVAPIPSHLRDPHSGLGKQEGNSVGYQYSHNFKDGLADQSYLTVPKEYYLPKDSGYEIKLKELMAFRKKRLAAMRATQGGNA